MAVFERHLLIADSVELPASQPSSREVQDSNCVCQSCSLSLYDEVVEEGEEEEIRGERNLGIKYGMGKTK